MNQRYGHSDSAWPEQSEKDFVKSILVVYHSAHSPRLQLRRVYSGMQVVSSIHLGLPLKVLHMNQHLQLAPHPEEGSRVQDDKVAGRRVCALHKRDGPHIRHLPLGGREQCILLHAFPTGQGLVLIATVRIPGNACSLRGNILFAAIDEYLGESLMVQVLKRKTTETAATTHL